MAVVPSSLWIPALAGVYLAYCVYSARQALKTMQEDNEEFARSDNHPRVREEAPKRLKQLVGRCEEILLKRGYHLLATFTNRGFMGGANFYFVFVSSDRKTVCEFAFYGLPLMRKLRDALLFMNISQLFSRSVLYVSVETKFESGDTLATSDIELPQAPWAFPQWIHIQSIIKGAPIETYLDSHERRLGELALKPVAIRSIEHYFELGEDQRARLARHNTQCFDRFVEENDLDWLAQQRKEN